MSIDRLLTKKNLITLGVIALFIQATLSLLDWFLNVDWLYIVDYILLGITGFVAILFFARNKTPIRFQPAQMLLILFMGWMILSCLSMTVTYGSDWVSYNNAAILNTAVEILLAFPLGYVLIREKKNTIGGILLHILVMGWTLFITYVLINVFQGKTVVAPNGGGLLMKDGSLCLNCNRNTTGSWEMLFFIVCFFMMLWNRKRSLRIIYAVATFIHYFALTLSSSRAAIFSVLFGMMAMTGIAVYLRLGKQKMARKLAIALASALVAGAAFYFLRPLVFKLLALCTGSSESGREMIYQDRTLSGRTDIWRWTIEGIFTSFRCAMFGVTPRSTPEMIAQMSNGAVKDMYTHNQILEIAASIGIPGLCIALAWFAIILKDSYKLFFVQKDMTPMLAIPVMILVLMLANMMEAYLVFYDHIDGYVFFLLCGLLYGGVNKPIMERKLSRQESRRKARKKKK